MPGPMSQSDGKLLRKLPGAYWSQRLRMGWSSKGEIVRVTMPSITPSLGFFFHLRSRGVGVGVGGSRGAPTVGYFEPRSKAARKS